MSEKRAKQRRKIIAIIANAFSADSRVLWRRPMRKKAEEVADEIIKVITKKKQ